MWVEIWANDKQDIARAILVEKKVAVPFLSFPFLSPFLSSFFSFFSLASLLIPASTFYPASTIGSSLEPSSRKWLSFPCPPHLERVSLGVNVIQQRSRDPGGLDRTLPWRPCLQKVWRRSPRPLCAAGQTSALSPHSVVSASPLSLLARVLSSSEWHRQNLGPGGVSFSNLATAVRQNRN